MLLIAKWNIWPITNNLQWNIFNHHLLRNAQAMLTVLARRSTLEALVKPHAAFAATEARVLLDVEVSVEPALAVSRGLHHLQHLQHLPFPDCLQEGRHLRVLSRCCLGAP